MPDMLHIFWDYTSCPLRKSAGAPAEIRNSFLNIAKDLDMPTTNYSALGIHIFTRNPKVDSITNPTKEMLNEWKMAGAKIRYVNDGVSGSLEYEARKWFYSLVKKAASSNFLVVTGNRQLWSTVFSYDGRVGFGWAVEVLTDGKVTGRATLHRCAPAVIAEAEYEWDTALGAVIPYDGEGSGESGEDEFDAIRTAANLGSGNSSFSDDEDDEDSPADVVPFSASLDFADTLQVFWDYENCNLRSTVGMANILQSFDLAAADKGLSQMCISMFCKHYEFGVVPTQATVQDLRSLGVNVSMANDNVPEICDDMIVQEVAARAKFAMVGPTLLVTGDRKLIKRVQAAVLKASPGKQDYLGAFEFCGNPNTNPSNRYCWDPSSGIRLQN
ncbi:hypothetical protein RvY_01039-2 [Ramazzottius varieornatus]|uniref:NYN domain-containing protein n=1 Tax=Ramazzottius varieornatus TaxID=947166 RepID=A0A1D1UFU6_RAMVA|nr:hypothetical protein RvY_01039-2 [Ramazzottius varieornatus]